MDFYVDDHWNKLPLCWRNTFASLNPEKFSELLPDSKCAEVWPLSLLSLKIILRSLCIPRSQNEQLSLNDIPVKSCLEHPKVRNIFSKCVKPKKRHEIVKMAEVCYQSAKKCDVRYVVDFGAGLGHLARVIAYGYGLKVCCLEMQADLNKQAEVIDQKFETTAGKHFTATEMEKYIRPIHTTLRLTKDVTAEDFVCKIKSAFNIKENDRDFFFGIIGLHPCGDLGAILIKLFLSCSEAKFLNIVGCCYMKLTTDIKLNSLGYPLSCYLRNLHKNVYHLSYESREIACHAIETYTERLECRNYENLKVHSYRATLEKIIVKYWPDLRHSGLKSVKHTNALSFSQYCEKAMKNMEKQIPLEDIHSCQTVEYLEQWKRVVIFYSLRLMFAPLVESVILYDRILHLLENDCNVNINSIFDPKISPRNHITTAIKPI